MEELISIIIPVYQGEKTIKKCIESVLNSSYPYIEVIVVNDGSTDNTANIVAEMSLKDSRIRLINNPGKGVSSARNTGLRNARGEFFGFVDADDAIDEKMYETLRDNLADDCDMVLCGTVHCKKQGEIPPADLPELKRYERECPLRALETVIYERTTMSACTKLFKRSIIRSADGNIELLFPEDQEHYEDFIFVCRYVARCRKKIRLVPEYFYFYTSTHGSLSNKPLPAEMMARSLTPLLDLGKTFGGSIEKIVKIFYAETFVKKWYVEQIKRDRNYNKSELIELKQEAKRYSKQYFSSKKVPLFWKSAAWMMLYCETITKIAVKLFGSRIAL